MVHPDTNPACISGDIVDTIWHRTTECFAEEVVNLDFFGIALASPFPASILEVANQFFLLGVDRDHWLLHRQSRFHALVDVDELSVPVGMIASLMGLAVGLKAELLPFEQFTDHGAADPVATCA